MNTKRKKKENGGYIALISTIIISLILLGLTANMSTAGFFVRFNSLDSEYKRISLGLAESCVHAALLKLAKDNTYAPPLGGESVSVGTKTCIISEVLTDLSDPTKKTVKTKANFQGAFSNMEIASTVQDPAVSPRIPAYIFVVVQVLNNDPGGVDASAGDFTVNLTAINPSANSFPGAETPGPPITADAGPYSISETGPAGYLTTYSADCSGTVAEGEPKTCTITNNDIPTTATLTVIANVIRDNGGPLLRPSDFPLFIDGASVTNGTGVTVSPGSHTVTGSGAAGYNPSPWGGHCGPGGTITLAAGDSKTCSITYDDIPPATLQCADTVMMLDRTGSMTALGDPPCPGCLAIEGAAAKKLLDLYSGVTPHPQVGIGSLEGIEPGASELYPPIVPVAGRLTNNYGTNIPPRTRLYNLIDTITSMPTAWKGTNIAAAISAGDSELNSTRHIVLPTPLKKVLILFSDGIPNAPVEATAPELARIAADNAKIPHGSDGKSTQIFTFYFGSNSIGRNLMAQLATGETPVPGHQPGSKNDIVTGSAAEIAAENSDSDNFFTSPSVADMVPIFATIAERICPAVASPPPPPPPTTATINVIKEMVNDSGGTKVANDFTMIISAVNPSINSFPGVASPGRAVTVDPGSYSVDEGPTGPYTKTIGAGCSGSIAAGETRTCTIRNDDTPPPSSPPPPPPPPPPITIESWVEQPSGP